MIRTLWAFFRRDLAIAGSYRLQAFFQVASMFSVAVTFFFLSLMLRRVEGAILPLQKYGGSYFSFVLIGLATSMYVDASLRSFATAVRTAQITGTFEAMLTTQTPIGVVVAGSALWTLFATALRSLILVGLGVTVFGVHLHTDAAGTAALVVALTVACTLALGIFSAGFIVLFKQGDPLTTAISGLSWLLSGVLYPKEILPLWVQEFARVLPLTHALEALRLMLLQGAPPEAVARGVGGLAVLAGVGLPVSLAWFAWAVRRARIAGSLAKY